jgi:hypothetical protein
MHNNSTSSWLIWRSSTRLTTISISSRENMQMKWLISKSSSPTGQFTRSRSKALLPTSWDLPMVLSHWLTHTEPSNIHYTLSCKMVISQLIGSRDTILDRLISLTERRFLSLPSCKVNSTNLSLLRQVPVTCCSQTTLTP